MTLSLEHITDLDRSRIAHVISQRVKEQPADPLFLGLPSDETYAINGVARFLRTEGKIKIFGNNDTTFKTVFTNLGRNENIYMYDKYLGLQDSKFGLPAPGVFPQYDFHPLIKHSKIQTFIGYNDPEIAHHMTTPNVIVGHETRFVVRLVQSLNEQKAQLNLVVVAVEDKKCVVALQNTFQTGWTCAVYTVGKAQNMQYNFLAWTYDVSPKTVEAIVKNIHPQT